MNVEIYADRIFYYQDAVADSEELVALLESIDESLDADDAITKWNDWTSPKGDSFYTLGKQKHTDSSKLGTSSKEVNRIYEALSGALLSCGMHYSEALGIEYIDPSPISISKYQQGSEMGPHVDWHGDESVEPLMSAVLYLNDDYEGGELDFPDLNVRIKPKAGSIVIFPSVAPYYHQSMLVKSGVKYMSPAFWIKRLR